MGKCWPVKTLWYVLHSLSYVALTNPNASDAEKTNRLIDGLPRVINQNFVRYAQTVHAITERLKSVTGERAYKLTTISSRMTAASLAAMTNA